MAESLIILIVGLLVGLPIWGIVDAIMRPARAWRAVRQNQILWVLLQFFLGVIGAAVYFLVIRPKVKAAQLGSAS